MSAGIVFGLLTAFCQSLYYLLTRRFTRAEGRDPLQLLVLSHLWTALLALPVLLVLLRHYTLPHWSTWLAPLLVSAGFYLAGHAALFLALRRSEPSRISPMLGLKVVMLAVISVLFLGADLKPGQWLAVGLSTAAAFVLNYTGGSLPLGTTLAALGACLGYTLSDLGIRALNLALATQDPKAGPIVGCCLSFLVCGLAALVLLPLAWRPGPRIWRDSFPVALAWFGAMVCMFTAFHLVGVVLGNILQATRGLQSILMALLVARAGWVHLEPTVQAHVFWRRFTAAACMVAAVALYLW